MQSYWQRVTAQRLSRRRAMAATGAGAMGAALLAACGGGDSGNGGEEASGLVSKPVDTSKQAKAGGVYKGAVTQDVQTFEPTFRSAPAATHSQRAYQSMLVTKPGYLEPAKDEYEGDVIESWEFSADRLTWTLKMRPNTKWDARAPTNSRAVDANDMVFSWQRYERIGALRSDYANSVNAAAPVVSMTATDARTVVVKLARPEAGILARFASRANSAFWVLPKEADGGFDPRSAQRGSGPYTLAEYTPSARFVYERNPNYYDQTMPRIQRLELPIVTEAAQRLAQFRSGELYTTPIAADDIIPTKNSVPELSLFQADIATSGFRWFYGWQDGPKSPFRDVRLRQAMSMSVDRDLFIDTFYNVPQFESEGLPMERRWNSAVRVDAPGWWLDPQSKDFGENAKFYKHDIAEAKKLLSAAGFANGLDTDAHHITTADYGVDFPKQVEVILGMAREAGIRLQSAPANFATDWQQKYRDVKGNFDGMALVLQVGSGDPGDLMFSLFNSSGSQFMGWDPNGQSTFKGDPTMDDLTTKMRAEFDANKRYAMGHELQKLEAKQQYYPMFPGGANNFVLAWPVLGNFRVYDNGLFAEYYYWIDDTKPPIKRA